MKSAILLLIVTIAMVHGQANVTLDCENAPAKFAIQETLQIEFLDTIAFSNTSCGTEYQAYGSCCSISSLKTKSDQLNASLVSAVSKIKSEYTAFADAVNRLEVELKTIVDSQDIQSDARYTSRRTKARLVRDSKAFLFLKAQFTSSQQANFSSSMDKCFPDVSRARSSALCIVCAARSPFFLTESNHVVISNQDCALLSDRCRDAVNNLRTFSQGLQLYTSVLSPVLGAGVHISTDAGRVDVQGLAALEKYLVSENINVGLTTTVTDQSNGFICQAVASAGKPTLVEAMADLFNSDFKWGISNIDRDINQNINKLDQKTEELENVLTDGFNATPQLPAEANTAVVTSLLASVLDRVRDIENHRKRLLQSIGSRLDVATFKQYIDEIDVILFGTVRSEIQKPIPTVVKTGSDLELGNSYDLFLGSSLSVQNAELYKLGSSGQLVVSYQAPSATNPAPIQLTNLLQPITLTPIDLKITN